MWTAAAARSQGFSPPLLPACIESRGWDRQRRCCCRPPTPRAHPRKSPVLRSRGCCPGCRRRWGLSCLRRGIGGALYLYAHGGDQLCGGRWCPDSRSYGLYVRIDTFETGRVHDDDRDAGFAHGGECFLVPSVAYNQIRVSGNYLLSVGLEISNLLYLNCFCWVVAKRGNADHAVTHSEREQDLRICRGGGYDACGKLLNCHLCSVIIRDGDGEHGLFLGLSVLGFDYRCGSRCFLLDFDRGCGFFLAAAGREEGARREEQRRERKHHQCFRPCGCVLAQGYFGKLEFSVHVGLLSVQLFISSVYIQQVGREQYVHSPAGPRTGRTEGVPLPVRQSSPLLGGGLLLPSSR